MIRRKQIALVETYDSAANPRVQTSREFRRVALVDRDSVLIEETPEAFASAHALPMLRDDRVATNPAIRFHVEGGSRQARTHAFKGICDAPLVARSLQR